MRSIVFLSLTVCIAWAQQDAAPLAFEVASVKVAAPLTPGSAPGPVIRTGGCGVADPAMVHCTNATLKTLLMRAYGAKAYQIQGPAWIGSDGYDVMAKVPDGVPADRVPAMLQALLADRFGVKIHKETRVLPAYELSVAKGGPKLKEVETAKLPAMLEPGSALALPEPHLGSRLWPLSTLPVGAAMTMTSPNGLSVIRGNITIEQLVKALASSLNRPVFDNTGLKATYEIELSYLGEEIGGGRDDAPRQQDANAPVATLFQAVQETLGLKLEAKKAPVEMIVVDSANKVPTGNLTLTPMPFT